MERRARWLWIGSLWLALACGSSSGGGGGDTVEASITVDGAPLIAAEVVRGINLTADLGSLDGTGDDADALASSDVSALGAGGVGAAAVLPPTTIACPFGGSLRISGDVATPGTPSAGDEFSIRFTACRQEEDGATLTGDFDFTVLGFAGDFGDGDGAFSWQLDLTLTDLVLQQDTDPEEVAFDGRIQLLQNTLEPDLAESLVSGGTLTARDGAHEITLLNFGVSLAEEIDPDEGELTGDYQIDGVGILTSSLFEGRVRFNVLELFEGELPDPPAAGEMLITGANGASIRLLPNGANVDLVVDLDGESGPLPPEPTITLSWEELFEVGAPFTTSFQEHPMSTSGVTMTMYVVPPPPEMTVPEITSFSPRLLVPPGLGGAGGVLLRSQVMSGEAVTLSVNRSSEVGLVIQSGR